MILSIITVGDSYIDKVLPYINNFIQLGYNVNILTDQPEKYFGLDVKTFSYDKKIFSYFDKIIFPLKLLEKNKLGVLYVDADLIPRLSTEFLVNFKGGDNFLYFDTWPDGETFKSYQDSHYFKILIDYFKQKNILEYDKLITILEWVYYFPIIDDETISNLLMDIEKVKPVFEYMSVMVDSGYSGIGNGEGVALSYVLGTNKIPHSKFKDMVFNI